MIEFPIEGQTIALKAGYPTTVSEASKLGKLLTRFGAKLEVGSEVDPNNILVGQQCQFQTITETTKNGEFAKVLSESVKPR